MRAECASASSIRSARRGGHCRASAALLLGPGPLGRPGRGVLCEYSHSPPPPSKPKRHSRPLLPQIWLLPMCALAGPVLLLSAAAATAAAAVMGAAAVSCCYCSPCVCICVHVCDTLCVTVCECECVCARVWCGARCIRMCVWEYGAHTHSHTQSLSLSHSLDESSFSTSHCTQVPRLLCSPIQLEACVVW